MRLFLVGDDDALDVLAELSRHLDYFEVARGDDLPDALGPDDHVVIGVCDAAASSQLLARALASAPGFATTLPAEPARSPGARAIVIAAQLVAAFPDRARN